MEEKTLNAMCHCCRKIKDCILIDSHWVCEKCNHLETEIQEPPIEID